MTPSPRRTPHPGNRPGYLWPEPAQSALFATLEAALAGVPAILTPMCLELDTSPQPHTERVLHERYLLLTILRSSTRLQLALAQYAKLIEKDIPF